MGIRDAIKAMTPRLTPRSRKGPAKAEQIDDFTRRTKDVKDVYEVKEELGQGGFATVNRGIDRRDNSEWALKFIKNDVYQQNSEVVKEEVQVLKYLATFGKNDGLVQFREVILSAKHFTIAMELLRGGELFDRIVEREYYTEVDAKKVVTSMLETLEFMHANNVAHRDIKPENYIFVDRTEESALKLTDFGFAKHYDEPGTMTDSCGTPEYVAPEVLDDAPYDEKCDIWSIGVIVYILLCGFPPFYAETDQELFDNVQNAKYQFLKPYWDPVSEEAKDLIRKLLVVNPNERLSATEALNHKWLKSDAGAGNDLSGAKNQIMRYQAIHRLREAVQAIIARNRIELMFAQTLDNAQVL